MHSFEVHSNESVCRKKVRLGLEQVNSRWKLVVIFTDGYLYLFHQKNIDKELIQQPLVGFHMKGKIGKANIENRHCPLYRVEIRKTWAATDHNELVNSGD